MKSRTIEIIDNHIKALEEELEWYQQKNREWQEKCEALEKQNLIETYPTFMTFLGRPIDYWLTLQHYADINCVDELVVEVQKSRQENARLRDQLRWHPVSELPKRDESIVRDFLIDVFLDIDGVATYKAFYDFLEEKWVDLRTGKKISISKHKDIRWCYIPEGGDA